MKATSVAKITREVVRKFPEMARIKPTVRQQGTDEDQYLLTFKGRVELPGGREINRIVRVVADERGRVIKMSTSK